MSLPSPDNLADRNVDSKDTELRYAAYGARLRTALRASQRYLAYVRLFLHLAPLMIRYNFPLYQTSDVGEAFRPIVPPSIVTAAYGISWLYLAG
jgi:fission process protein 1